jgi:transposase
MTLLRLPPYHPELNAIEKIWALVKNWVAANNVSFKLDDVEQLARTRF